MRLVMLLLMLPIAFAPSGAAHYCDAPSGCDPSTCVDGEYHDHTKRNSVGQDEYCRSEAADEEGACIIADLEFPRAICRTLEGAVDAVRDACAADSYAFTNTIPRFCS